MKKKQLSLDGLHGALLCILEEFDRICRENNLRYSLMYGTLIGAVRHKGFIPWDDDVDVAMPRPDYERFLELVRHGAAKEHFFLTPDRGKKAEYPFVKFCDDRYPIKSSTHIEVKFLNIDVFPFDGMPKDEKEARRVLKKQRERAFDILLCRWFTVYGFKGKLLWIFCWWFYLFPFLYGKQRYVKKIRKIALKYPYDESDFVVNHAWGTFKGALPRECFEDYIELEFEGKNFRAIKEWDRALKQVYGDYMMSPPECKRVLKHMTRSYPKENAPIQE